MRKSITWNLPALANPSRIVSRVINNGSSITISPEMAEIILKNYNKHNRSMRHTKIRKYSELMKSGKWDTDFTEGMTLVVGEDGGCLSAQHRLAAMIAANVTLTFTVSVVDRSKWVELTVESRSAKDKITMLDKRFDEYQSIIPTAVNLLSGLVNRKAFTKATGGTGDFSKMENILDTYGEKLEYICKKFSTIPSLLGLTSKVENNVLKRALAVLYAYDTKYEKNIDEIIAGEQFYLKWLAYLQGHGDFNLQYIAASLKRIFDCRVSRKYPTRYSPLNGFYLEPTKSGEYRI